MLPLHLADTLSGVLTDTRPQPAVEANRSARSARRRRGSLALVVVPLVLVVAAVGLFVALSRGDGGGLPIIGGDDGSNDVVPIEFEIRKTRAIATTEDADLEALGQRARALGEELAPVLDDLFTAAFLDPGHWREGDYEEVWAAFSEGARATAQESVETLTLGASAGDVYGSVVPKKGTLDVRVLFDAEGQPTSAVVSFRFSAIAARTDETYTAIVSDGQLVFGDPGAWKITAFNVTRDDRTARPPATPTPSASPS